MLFNIAFKNLIGAGIRTWLNVFVTSVSLFMIIFSSGMYSGMMQHAMQVAIDTEIAGGAYWHSKYDPFDPISFEDAHDVTPDIFKKLIKKDKAVQVLVSQASIYPNGRIMPVAMKGITVNQTVLNIPSISLSEYEGSNIPVLIGKGMAEYANLDLGDTFTIRWMDANNSYDAMEGEIVHIMDVGNFKIDMGNIWISIDKLQSMLSIENHSSYIVYKDDFNPKMNSNSWIERDVEYLVRDMQAMIDLDRPNAIVIYVILLSLAAMGIFNAQILSIFRRIKEIGTLMALGMERKKVVMLFTLEGGLNAFFAVITTIVLFGPVLYYFSIYGIPLPIDYSEMGLIIAKKLIPVYSLLLLFATTIIVSFVVVVVSYLPSRKISHMKPTDAIKGRAVI